MTNMPNMTNMPPLTNETRKYYKDVMDAMIPEKTNGDREMHFFATKFQCLLPSCKYSTLTNIADKLK